ncbi:lipoate--protein ligase family protein [Anaerosinus massiliensis]|uniref:lipoate--protein ligase family protein n=1 Tax=Massilibacillus massiliensis TaxID=1806837 RepID=UPI000A773040|nr:biotin/lipoate A/B protein ligase family protein [Massilibacillus massiliensis]
MKWRVIHSGIADAATNMAVDEAILSAHIAGKVPPTLRFYGWQPAAVSLGYFQRAMSEIDLTKCKEANIDVVRRLTGGRAVLHDAELTYSIVVHEDAPHIPKTITASYCYLSKGLLVGLEKLGITAEMTVPTAAYGQKKKQAVSAACFDAPSYYELTVAGRKLVGSAQVRKNGVILQHGSLLLRFSAEKFVDVLKNMTPEKKVQMIELLNCRATSIEEILKRPITWQEVCRPMPEAFATALDIDLVEDQLTAEETDICNQLAAEKYSQDAWNRQR